MGGGGIALIAANAELPVSIVGEKNLRLHFVPSHCKDTFRFVPLTKFFIFVAVFKISLMINVPKI